MKKIYLLLMLALAGITAASANAVSGTVTKANLGNPAYPANVYLIHKTWDNNLVCYVLTLIDSLATDSTGYFEFTNVTYPAGDLLVKAALDISNNDYPHYLPTYKENSLTWDSAHVVSFTAGDNNIHLVHGTNPGGPDFIGGSVLQGANKSTAVGDPMPNRLLILTTAADVAVAYTYTDATGHFTFPNLADGSYKLFGDAMGKQNPPLLITLSASNMSVNTLFSENSHSFTGQIATGIVPVALRQVKLYPNPVTSDAITVTNLGEDNSLKTISVTSLDGRKISSAVTTANETNITLPQLAKGIYIVTVQTNTGAANYRLIK